MKNLSSSLSILIFILIGSFVYGNNEKYRIMFRDDPSTTMVIGWNQTSGTNPIVYYDTVDHGTNFANYAFSQAPNRTTNTKGMNNQFVRLSGLQPNTAYYFVINDSQGISQRFWFKTIPDDPNIRLSIVAGGDSRNNRTPRQNANRLVAKLRPHVVFFGGDMTDSDSNTQWNNWMNDWQLTIGSDGRMIPIVAARGNHDSNNVVRDLFDIPTAAGGEYYALSFGGNLLRSYTLNTEITPGGSQGNWLAKDLAANAEDHYWSTAQYHRATRPHEPGKSEQNGQYNAWSIPFYTHGVQLVMESDSHVVKTTWPVIPSTGSGSSQGFIQNNTDPNRTVYVGEGCWGAPLRSASDTKPWTRVAGSFNQFKWLWVNKTTIELRTINVNNASSVGQVSDSNLFAEPSSLNVWNGGNSSRVIIIDNPKSVTPPDSESPTSPTNLISTNITDTSVDLLWTASTDNIRVVGYDIYDGTTVIGTSTTTTHTLTSLSPSTSYALKVRAKDAAGNMSGDSNIVNIMTDAPVVYTLTVNVVGMGSVTGAGNYNSGSTANLSATPNANYTFNGWSGDLSGSTNPGSIFIDGNKTVTATFSEITEAILTENTSVGDKIEVNDGQNGAQSFVYTGYDYEITKVLLYLSRDSSTPESNLEFSIGTGVNSGTVSGSNVSITPSQVTNTSEGSNFTAYEIAFTSPVGSFTSGVTYYLNFTSSSSNKYYLQYTGDNTYTDGTYYKSGDNDNKDITFTVLGKPTNTLSLEPVILSENSIFVFPNPVGSEPLMVKLSNYGEGVYSIRIYDLTGRLKSEQFSSSDTVTIDVNNLANGIYFVAIKTNTTTVTKKFIKR